MRTVLRYGIGWIIAVLICLVLALIFSSQNVIGRLGDSGAEVGFSERVSMTIYDIAHMGGIYGLFISLALLIAMPAGGLVHRFVRFGRPLIYIIAGATAMLVMLTLMKQVFFGVDAVAGARDIPGKLMQIIAGGIGGYVFHRLTRKRFEA